MCWDDSRGGVRPKALPVSVADGNASYYEASLECHAQGWQLCEAQELAACCDGGCGYDTVMIWTQSQCFYPPDPPPPLAPPPPSAPPPPVPPTIPPSQNIPPPLPPAAPQLPTSSLYIGGGLLALLVCLAAVYTAKLFRAREAPARMASAEVVYDESPVTVLQRKVEARKRGMPRAHTPRDGPPNSAREQKRADANFDQLEARLNREHPGRMTELLFERQERVRARNAAKLAQKEVASGEGMWSLGSPGRGFQMLWQSGAQGSSTSSPPRSSGVLSKLVSSEGRARRAEENKAEAPQSWFARHCSGALSGGASQSIAAASCVSPVDESHRADPVSMRARMRVIDQCVSERMLASGATARSTAHSSVVDASYRAPPIAFGTLLNRASPTDRASPLGLPCHAHLGEVRAGILWPHNLFGDPSTDSFPLGVLETPLCDSPTPAEHPSFSPLHAPMRSDRASPVRTPTRIEHMPPVRTPTHTERASPLGKCARASPVGKCSRASPAGKCARTPPVGKCVRASPVSTCARTPPVGRCARASPVETCERTPSDATQLSLWPSRYRSDDSVAYQPLVDEDFEA